MPFGLAFGIPSRRSNPSSSSMSDEESDEDSVDTPKNDILNDNYKLIWYKHFDGLDDRFESYVNREDTKPKYTYYYLPDWFRENKKEINKIVITKENSPTVSTKSNNSMFDKNITNPTQLEAGRKYKCYLGCNHLDRDAIEDNRNVKAKFTIPSEKLDEFKESVTLKPFDKKKVVFNPSISLFLQVYYNYGYKLIQFITIIHNLFVKHKSNIEKKLITLPKLIDIYTNAAKFIETETPSIQSSIDIVNESLKTMASKSFDLDSYVSLITDMYNQVQTVARKCITIVNNIKNTFNNDNQDKRLTNHDVMRNYMKVLGKQFTHYQTYHKIIINHYAEDFTNEKDAYLCSEEFIDFHPYLPTISIDGDVSFEEYDPNDNDPFRFKRGLINPVPPYKTSYKIAYFNNKFYLFSMRLFTAETECEDKKCFSYDTFIPVNIRLSMGAKIMTGVENLSSKFNLHFTRAKSDSTILTEKQVSKPSILKKATSWFGIPGGTKRHKMKRPSKHKRHSNPIRRTPQPLRRNKSTRKRK